MGHVDCTHRVHDCCGVRYAGQGPEDPCRSRAPRSILWTVHALVNEVFSEMPEAYIVIFLLFFAVLAFGWFYWQRAKSRTDTPSATTTPDTDAQTPADQ